MDKVVLFLLDGSHLNHDVSPYFSAQYKIFQTKLRLFIYLRVYWLAVILFTFDSNTLLK